MTTELQANPALKRKSRYNPRVVPRAYKQEYVGVDGVYHYSVGSFTRPGSAIRHYQDVDPNGPVNCSCEDFRTRHAQHEPTLDMPEHWCKHISDVVEIMEGDGVLDDEAGRIRQNHDGDVLPEAFCIAMPKIRQVHRQLFVYADADDTPECMQLLAVEHAASPQEAVRLWLSRYRLHVGVITAQRCPGEIRAWEIRGHKTDGAN